MKKVFLLVEGQTEEEFVAEVLRPDLRNVGVELVPVLLKTKRVKSGGHFRGGVSNYAAVRGDTLRLLKDTSAVLVTSMLDLYGLPDDFPGVGQRGTNATEWALNVERAWQLDIGSERFRPYLSIHEFEAFAFVAPQPTSRTKRKIGRASRGRWAPPACGEGFSWLRPGRPKEELPPPGAPWTDECLTDKRDGPA